MKFRISRLILFFLDIQNISLDLLNNDYFKAGTGLFGIALGTAMLRKCAQALQIFTRRNYTMTLEIPSYDKSYQWISPWVAKQTKASHISVQTAFQRSDTGKIETHYQYIPSPGVHYFFYHNRIIKAERSRTQPTMASQHGGTPFESLTLTTIGKNRQYFQSILELAKVDALKEEEGWTIVYKAMGAEWRPFGYPRARRPLSSVVLDQGIAERLVDDVHEFIDKQAWYRQRGVPYRRGYLLYGPPGCGKSSFIAALAGELEYSICVLSLSEMGMSGDRLDHLMAHAPLQSIILLEDIDAAFIKRDEIMKNPIYQGMASLTLSGLLNALDGVSSTEGLICRLDPALVRPGRVDLSLELSLCSDNQLRKMFQQFYPTCDSDLISQFVGAVGPGIVSPAQVQGFLLCHKEKPLEALKHIKELVPTNAGNSASNGGQCQ